MANQTNHKEKQSPAEERVQAMLKYFFALRGEKEDGVLKYTFDYCVSKTAKKFFYSKSTVENYVSTKELKR